MVYFQKSEPAPECLNIEKAKNNGDYKCGNVLERIKQDFKNKCYICECKAPHTINVEHFRPHKGNTDLKFSWANLYWSCGHCNSIKSDRYSDIINCTDKNERVEERIKISMKPFPMEKVLVEALDPDSSTISTKELLDKVYNGTTVLKTLEAANIRSKILEQIRDFQQQLVDYYDSGDNVELKNFSLLKIKGHLMKSSSFTAIKRSIIRDNSELNAEFSMYFD